MKIVDLAVAAGRKRQSQRTKFIHEATAVEVIPVYENFCFAFALFRQKTAEAILEGRELVDRLLAFQTGEGNFPIYIHDYPKCWNVHLGLKVAPILIHLLRDFGLILGDCLKVKLEVSIKKILHFSETGSPLPPLWEMRFLACKGVDSAGAVELSTAEQWYEWLISEQLSRKEGIYPIPFNSRLQVFLGTHETQEEREPQPVPIEYILAEKQGLDGRFLRDCSSQILAAPLFPTISSMEKMENIFFRTEREWRTSHSLEREDSS